MSEKKNWDMVTAADIGKKSEELTDSAGLELFHHLSEAESRKYLTIRRGKRRSHTAVARDAVFSTGMGGLTLRPGDLSTIAAMPSGMLDVDIPFCLSTNVSGKEKEEGHGDH